VDFRRVYGRDLIVNEANPRLHPNSQIDALSGLLEEVGMVGAVIAREVPDGLELVDGHLRAELLPHQQVPTLVVDLSDEEMRLVLASYDQVTTQAKLDPKLYAALLAKTQPRTEAVSAFLQKYAAKLPPPTFTSVGGLELDDEDYSDLDAPNTEEKAGLVVSQIRMVQLFYTVETQPEFLKMVDALASVYGVDGLSETVWTCVSRAYKALAVQSVDA
jgi:hypothetical protein